MSDCFVKDKKRNIVKCINNELLLAQFTAHNLLRGDGSGSGGCEPTQRNTNGVSGFNDESKLIFFFHLSSSIS